MHDTEDYEGKDLHCPCTDYTVKNKCECGLYLLDSIRSNKAV
jgi:ferredoxin-thioredoxin reductase catalytic subunit